jgi:hypothetical protein
MPGGSKDFKIPLPKLGEGKIVGLTTAGSADTPGIGFSGVAHRLSIGNLGSLSSDVRAAAVAIPAGPGTYDIFVAINAPKSVHVLGSPASGPGSAHSLELIVAAAVANLVYLAAGDGCKFLSGQSGGRWIRLGRWSASAKSIFSSTEAADPHCN